MNTAVSLKKVHNCEKEGVEPCGIGEDHGRRIDLGISAEEPSGIEVATCIESSVRNWRDPTRHSEAVKDRPISLRRNGSLSSGGSQRGS